MGELRALWGTDHKVGTTMLAQTYAEIVAEPGNKTLLLTMSTSPGDDFYDENANSIEELKSRLSCGLITKDNIFDYALKGHDIYKINGFINQRVMYEFTGKMVQDLLDVCVEAFDNVVADCGTGLDNPLAFNTLKYSRNNIFIFSQQESSIRSWELQSESISRQGIVPSVAVVNKFFKGDKNNTNYISQRTGIPHNIFRTVNEYEFGIQAEADRKTLLFYGDKQFEKDVKSII